VAVPAAEDPAEAVSLLIDEFRAASLAELAAASSEEASEPPLLFEEFEFEYEAQRLAAIAERFNPLPFEAADGADDWPDVPSEDAPVMPLERAPPPVPAIAPPRREDALAPVVRRRGRGRRSAGVAAIACTLLAVVGWHFVGVPAACSATPGMDVADRSAVNAVVGQIIGAESGGDPTAKNKLSSATGAGQFIDETWLEMVRRHRPDLASLDETAILDLRRDPDLAREMVTRFAERNAANLISRCLPVTAGTLYLSHFAGGAGAAALLSAAENADAATVMAQADSTGRTTRERLVTANPFLASFTVADLKDWADRKMAADYRPAAIAAVGTTTQ
jgi:hypothetical protein